MDHAGDSTSPANDEALPRRMRKGTNSCFECRRRKVRCTFQPENPSTCLQCFESGSRCIAQEHATLDVIVKRRRNLRERVASLEGFMKILLDKWKTAEALGGITSPTQSEDDTAHIADNQRAPLFRLFETDVWTRIDSKSPHNATVLAYQTPSIVTQSTDASSATAVSLESSLSDALPPASKANGKDEIVSQALRKAIPSQEKIQEAVEQHGEWWDALRTVMYGPGATAAQTSLKVFASQALAHGGPLDIAKVVQLVATVSDDATFEHRLTLVDRLILSDDEYIGTLEGLECALFQVKLYSESGKLRRAWIVHRRAISFAQVMGLHRTRVTPQQDILWWALFQIDRFSSLILGTPYAISDSHCNLKFGGKDLSLDQTYHGFIARLSVLIGAVIDRTQNASELSYPSLLETENELTRLGLEMPAEYWNLDHVAPKDAGDARRWQERSGGHLVFYQTRLILHMPYMLKSVDHTGFEYSRDLCFESARQIVRLVLKIRAPSNDIPNKYKAVDFVGLLGAITLVLGLLGYARIVYDPKQREEDWRLLDSIIVVFKHASTAPFGKVALKCYSALQQLTQFRTRGQGSNESTTTNLVIPFFGTITVKWGQALKGNALPATAAPAHGIMPTCTQPLETAMTHDLPLHNMHSSYSPMEPDIAYKGVYMQPSSFVTPAMVDDQMNAYTAQPYNWHNVGNFDLDQDWNWPMPETLQSSF